MFERTDQKMEDVRCALRALERATTQIEYKSHFLNLINTGRAVTLAAQAEGAHVPGFDDWYGPEQEALKADPVMRYVNKARVADFHRGEHDLSFRGYALHRMQVWEHCSIPGAQLQITSQGPAWVVQNPDGSQARYPADVSVVGQMNAALTGAPVGDPLELSRAVVEYLEALVARLHRQFPQPSA